MTLFDWQLVIVGVLIIIVLPVIILHGIARLMLARDGEMPTDAD